MRGELVPPIRDGLATALIFPVNPQPEELGVWKVSRVSVSRKGAVQGFVGKSKVYRTDTWKPAGVGSYIAVRECFRETNNGVQYRVDYPEFNRIGQTRSPEAGWRPAIKMKMSQARIFLKVKSIKAMRFDEITPAMAEMCSPHSVIKYSGWNLSSIPVMRALEEVHDRLESIKPRPRGGRGTKNATHFVSYPTTELALRQKIGCMKMPEHFKGRPWHVYPNPYVRFVSFERVTVDDVPKIGPHGANYFSD